MKKVICSQKAPGAIGPYSQAIEANGMIFVSGQLPIDATSLHLAHGLDREVEDHGLLDPLVDLPFAFGRVDGFRRAEFALVHQFDGLPHGLPHGLLLEQLAVFPSLPDYHFQFAVHNFPSVFASQSYAKTSIRRPNYLIFS